MSSAPSGVLRTTVSRPSEARPGRVSARVVAGARACDQFGARDLNLDGAPTPVARARTGGLVGDGVERAHLCGDFGVDARHVFEAVDFVQAAAGARGERVEAGARRGVDGGLLRRGLHEPLHLFGRRALVRRDAQRGAVGEPLEVAGGQRERVDGNALSVGRVEHGRERRVRVGFDQTNRFLGGLGRDCGGAILFAHVAVDPVGEDDDGLAPRAFAAKRDERVAQGFVEIGVAAAARAINGEGDLRATARKVCERLDVVNRLDRSLLLLHLRPEGDDRDAVGGRERVYETHGRLFELRAEAQGRAGHIEQEHKTEGLLCRLEVEDGLRHAVLEDGEVRARQVGDGAAPGVGDADVEPDEIRFDRHPLVVVQHHLLRARGRGGQNRQQDDGDERAANVSKKRASGKTLISHRFGNRTGHKL